MYAGIVLNVISNLAFVLSSYIIHFFLGKIMSPEEYGTLGSIITILDLEYLVLNNGVRQSLSGGIAEKHFNAIELIKKSLIFQTIMVLSICIINLVGANIMAELLLDTNMAKYIKLLAIIVPANGVYIIFLGINEGVNQFKASAIAGILYAAGKLSVVLYAGFLFKDGILATELGFLTALIIGILISGFFIFNRKNDFRTGNNYSITFISYVKRTVNFSVIFIVASIVLSMDTLFIKGLINNKEMAGFYTGAVNFAKVSYYILSAFFVIILPMAAKKNYEGSRAAVREMMEKILKLIGCFALPIAIILSAANSTLLKVFYGEKYLIVSDTLMILSLSHFCMGIFVIFNMVISALKHEGFSLYMAILCMIVFIPLCIFFTKRSGMEGAAFAGIICSFGGMCISGIKLKNMLDKLFTKEHFEILVINILFWILLKKICSTIIINNLFFAGLFYVFLYMIFIGILHWIKLCNFKEILFLLKGAG